MENLKRTCWEQRRDEKNFKLKNHFGSKRLKLLVITLHDGYFVNHLHVLMFIWSPFVISLMITNDTLKEN